MLISLMAGAICSPVIGGVNSRHAGEGGGGGGIGETKTGFPQESEATFCNLI